MNFSHLLIVDQRLNLIDKFLAFLCKQCCIKLLQIIENKRKILKAFVSANELDFIYHQYFPNYIGSMQSVFSFRKFGSVVVKVSDAKLGLCQIQSLQSFNWTPLSLPSAYPVKFLWLEQSLRRSLLDAWIVLSLTGAKWDYRITRFFSTYDLYSNFIHL